MRISTLSLLFALVFSVAAPLTAAIVVPPPATTEAGTPTKADIAAATAEYKATLAAMTAKERRAFKKNQKSKIKQLKEAVKSGASAAEVSTLLLVILALLIPPLAVYLHQGEINGKFWLNLVLTLLFVLPGVIHALIVVLGAAKKK